MELQEWRAVGASVVGTSHLKSGAPCQDSFAYQVLGGDDAPIAVLIASDGAGSAAHSEIGSQIACEELLQSAALYVAGGGDIASLTRDMARQWLGNVHEAIAHRAASNGHVPRDYACTLLAAFISPGHAAYLQLGDGAIVVRADGDEWCYVFWPQHGEYINSTLFVTDLASLERFEFEQRVDSVKEIACFTDGIESLVLQYATHIVHGPFFNRMFPAVRALQSGGFDHVLSARLAEYLSSEAICQRTDDDKTLVMATRLKNT